MAKIYKIELYVVDYNNQYTNAQEVVDDIEINIDNILMNCFETEETQIEWSDDIDLNRNNISKDHYEKYFNKER